MVELLKETGQDKRIAHPLTDDILLAFPSTENRGPVSRDTLFRQCFIPLVKRVLGLSLLYGLLNHWRGTCRPVPVWNQDAQKEKRTRQREGKGEDSILNLMLGYPSPSVTSDSGLFTKPSPSYALAAFSILCSFLQKEALSLL